MLSQPLSMSQAPEISLTVTVQNVVAWTQEEAFRTGEIGFDIGFADMHDIAQSFSHEDINAEKWPDPAEDDSFLVHAAMELHDSVRQMQHHQHLMDRNPEIVAAAVSAVDRQLAGSRGVGRPKKNQSLREKVVELSNRRNPRRKANYMTVWVKPVRTGGFKQMLEINLPLEATVEEVNRMLFEAIHFEIISPEATMSSNMPDMTARGFWKYQLLSRDLKRVIRKASVKLMTNNDYSQLTKTITKGTKPPIAVLSQERGQDPAASLDTSDLKVRSEMGTRAAVVIGGIAPEDFTPGQRDDSHVWDKHGVMTEPVDMDGNAYLDPVTPDSNKSAYTKINKKLQDFGWDNWPDEDDEEEDVLIESMMARDSKR